MVTVEEHGFELSLLNVKDIVIPVKTSTDNGHAIMIMIHTTELNVHVLVPWTIHHYNIAVS